MNQEIFEKMKKFIKEKESAGETDIKKIMEEFMKEYNVNLNEEYEESELSKAYALLEKAENAKTKASAKKLAMQAFETST